MDDGPVAFWSFDGNANYVAEGLVHATAASHGTTRIAESNLRPPQYTPFSDTNQSLHLAGGYLRIADSDPKFDFRNGDEITIEACVLPSQIRDGQNIYVFGKGRTNNPGFSRENQNYALRLVGVKGKHCISFLFRSRGKESKYHRWTSTSGFASDGQWRHIALSYRFGEPESLKGFIGGKRVPGVWDKAGKTTAEPVVDDDEIWIGSTLGGQASNTFRGEIDNLALFRKIIPEDRLATRFRSLGPQPYDWRLAKQTTPAGSVEVELFENVAANAWTPTRQLPDRRYRQFAMAAHETPRKYDRLGVIADRSNPFRLRMRLLRQFKPGKYRLLLRAKNASRLYVDGQLVAELGFMKRNSSGHEAVPSLLEATAGRHAAPPGHQERIVAFDFSAGPKLIRLETIVGGKGLRAELGELVAAVALPGQPFSLLTPNDQSRSFSEDGWTRYEAELSEHYRLVNSKQRRMKSVDEAKFWTHRHEKAREFIDALPRVKLPAPEKALPGNNSIDVFLNARLKKSGVSIPPLTNNYAFLRRVTLDIAGRNPSAQEIDAFLQDRNANRRAITIDRLLASPEWADNWMGYWQDVLAENPGILKPKLNNTGPFRWWIHESLLDNKPMDRFVSELVMMQGSAYGGGPAGFAMATQNDAPTAAKAHVLSQAFLGLEMTCARCHDAPFHPYTQKQLFSMAAMLNQSALTLPKTSTAPIGENGRESLITVSLRPGDKISAAWPFASLSDPKVAEEFARSANDSRARLAALITSPDNQRFAQVLVNRIWARYFGWGIVDPVDDWNDAKPSHPKLLDFLAREFVRKGYDMKHVARLILNSHAYQRIATGEGSKEVAAGNRLFASPRRRRLTAEQIVDSLLSASGKSMSAEYLTLDPEGRRSASTFLNLGAPRRGWELTSLSNERDRPALALPAAQSVIDVLIAFGWRDSRPNPQTERDQTPTILQPLTVANGVFASRTSRLSDNNLLTEFALKATTPDEFVESAFLQFLSRPPSSAEREPLAEFLRNGFEQRKTGKPKQSIPRLRNAVSWSNHLNSEATKIKKNLEQKVRQGDPPSPRLQVEWRERAEDVVWSIVNSPEFVFIP